MKTRIALPWPSSRISRVCSEGKGMKCEEYEREEEEEEEKQKIAELEATPVGTVSK